MGYYCYLVVTEINLPKQITSTAEGSLWSNVFFTMTGWILEVNPSNGFSKPLSLETIKKEFICTVYCQHTILSECLLPGDAILKDNIS